MTEMVQNSRQFDMERGLSNEEKLSRVQQATENQIQYRVARYGGPGAFNFETDIDDVKTVSKNKKTRAGATNSVSGKAFTEDVFSVAGNTTIPSYQEDAEEVDSFASSLYSRCQQQCHGNQGGQFSRGSQQIKPRQQNCHRSFRNGRS